MRPSKSGWLRLWPAILVLLHMPLCSYAQISDCRNPKSLAGANYDRLWQDFETLSSGEMQGRKPGTEGARLARRFIVEGFEASGLQSLKEADIFPQKAHLFDQTGWLHLFKPRFSSGDKKGANVVAVIKGSNKRNKAIVITAHYDHLGKQRGKVYFGANDNASGVAAMLFIAREFQKKPPSNHLVFVATDYEEAGLLGSKAFVKDQLLPHENVLLNINLDMIAQPGREWRLYIAGTRSEPQFRPIVDAVIANSTVCVKAGLDSPSWDYDRRFRVDWRRASDHWAFGKQDIPWLYVGVKDYRYYHTSRDETDKIPPVFYFGTVTASYQLVSALDKHFSGAELQFSTAN